MEFAQTRGGHLRNLGGELLDEACGSEGFEDPEPTRERVRDASRCRKVAVEHEVGAARAGLVVVAECPPHKKATAGSQHPAELECRVLEIVDVMDDL